MAKSRRLNQLLKRLEELRSHLLPSQFSATGQYSDKEYDMARAYVVLTHAELESYFEDRGRKIAQSALGRWKNKGSHTRILMALLRFHHLKSRKPWTPLEKTAERIHGAVNSYMTTIDSNHGVREDNLFGILFPLGFRPDQFDNVWLTTIDSFGQSRGAVAHTSVKTQQPIDPATEHQRVAKQIVPGLIKLDKKISRL
jgi:hypothetical protein